MTKNTNRQILDAWCQRVWAERDESAIHELFANSGSAGGLGRDKLGGPDEFVPFHRAICALLTDTQLEIDSEVEEGNQMYVLATFSGRSSKTGKKVSMEGSMAIEFANGQLLHCANHWEFMHLFEQLELLPKDTFATLLGAGRLAHAPAN